MRARRAVRVVRGGNEEIAVGEAELGRRGARRSTGIAARNALRRIDLNRAALAERITDEDREAVAIGKGKLAGVIIRRTFYGRTTRGNRRLEKVELGRRLVVRSRRRNKLRGERVNRWRANRELRDGFEGDVVNDRRRRRHKVVEKLLNRVDRGSRIVRERGRRAGRVLLDELILDRLAGRLFHCGDKDRGIPGYIREIRVGRDLAIGGERPAGLAGRLTGVL